jgi:hypothetical protein
MIQNIKPLGNILWIPPTNREFTARILKGSGESETRRGE